MNLSPLNLADGYKLDHRRQLPKGTIFQFNNFTPRKTRRTNVDKIVWFGLQYFIKKFLIKDFNENFFMLPKEVAIKRFKRRIDNYLGDGHRVAMDHFEALHDLQYLPIEIKSLPEGTRVNIKVPPVTIFNTHPDFAWLVGYLETIFSCTIWGPSTSATTAFEYRKLLNKHAMKTVGNTDFVQFQGHDFSMRGMFGCEAAMMSGGAHLLSFVGTDTICAIDFLEDYYGADSDKELVGCSVAATEHSVMCMGTGLYVYDKLKGEWERVGDAEFAVFKRLITEVYPDGIISIVSDTFNLWKVLNEFLPQLKEEILARNGKLVIRPDSGDPVNILTGYVINESKATHFYNQVAVDRLQDQGFDAVRISTGQVYNLNTMKEMTEPTEFIGVVESLYKTFGGKTNELGYKELDSHIGCIYGDSITLDRADAICTRLAVKGFASTNWVAGIGSYTYQYVTRDTDGWAMKATYGEVIGSDETILEIPIFKDPITDDGTKKSARGLLQVLKVCQVNQLTNKVTNTDYVLVDQVDKAQEAAGELKTVFRNSVLLKDLKLAEIRETIKQELAYVA